MTIGQIAFEAYSTAVGQVTHDGRPIPKWHNLTDEVRRGWEAAANAVVVNVNERDKTGNLFT